MRTRASFRPWVEQLEDRAVPAAYFVSPSGSDTSPGTSAAPWLTLQKAANTVRAGDSVTVRPGDYTGFDLRTDGTSAAPIVFTGEPGTRITTRNAATPDGINLEGASWITIQGFTVINQPRAGIRSVLNDHVTIRGNACDNNFRWGIFTAFSDDLLIENNVGSRSQDEHGIYVSNSGDRPVIRGNTLWGNSECGIHMNGDLSAGGDGVISGALVENNVLTNNGFSAITGLPGGSGINCDGVQNSVIRNNRISNSRASGISLYRIDGGAPSTGNQVLNNTVLVAADGRWALNIQNGSTNNTARNNLLFSAHSSRGAIDISSDSLSGFVSDYNAVENLFMPGGTIRTLAQWRTATGQDANSWVTPEPAPARMNNGGGNTLPTDSPTVPQLPASPADVGTVPVDPDSASGPATLVQKFQDKARFIARVLSNLRAEGKPVAAQDMSGDAVASTSKPPAKEATVFLREGTLPVAKRLPTFWRVDIDRGFFG